MDGSRASRRTGTWRARWVALAACGLSACTLGAVTAPSRTLDDALRSHPIVLLGEVHDNVELHRRRAAALRALLESGARPALLMEQFDRDRQGDLDRALARSDATPETVIAAAGTSDSMAGWSWPLYAPYIALAIAYRLPIVAVNVSRADTRTIVRDGLAATGFDAAVPADIRAVESDAIVASHCGLIDATQAGRMVDAQVARDQFMARAIAAHADGAILLAGNGHVRGDIGVPRWLPERLRSRSISIGLVEGDLPTAAFDVAIETPAQQRDDPCAAMTGSSAR